MACLLHSTWSAVQHLYISFLLKIRKKKERECFDEFRTPMVILMNAAILSKFEQKRFLDNELQLSQSKFSITSSHWARLFKLLWRWRSVLGMVLYIRDRWSWLFASFPWSAAVSVYRPINQFFFYINHNALASAVKAGSVIVSETVLAMPCWWVLTRTKQLSMAPTTGMIWLCACHTAELVACASVDFVVFFTSPPPPQKKKRKEKRKKTMHNHCFRFILGRLQYPGEIGNHGHAKFGGKQDALWSMWKWWIVTKE